MVGSINKMQDSFDLNSVGLRCASIAVYVSQEGWIGKWALYSYAEHLHSPAFV